MRKKASEFKNELEEEKTPKPKLEKKEKCEQCDAPIDFTSKLTKFCTDCSKQRSNDAIYRYMASDKVKEKSAGRSRKSCMKKMIKIFYHVGSIDH